jgi:hypothetical protein
MSDNNQTIPIRRQTINVPDFVTKAATDIPQPKESKYPTEIIPLPTKGWFYPEGHPLSTGEIEIKQMSAKEEDLLANQELIRKGKVLDKLIESVIVNKAIKIDDILIPDSNAIFIAMRRLAYGDEYEVLVDCPKCSVQNKVNINLSELSYKSFNFDEHPKGQNNFTFKLPSSGITVTYKLMSKTDEQSIDVELAQLRKISKDNTGELTTRLKYTLTSIDGNTDRVNIRKFVEERMVAKDSLALRKHMREYNPDVDMTFDFKCSECDCERRLDMRPLMGSSFLFPDSNS